MQREKYRGLVDELARKRAAGGVQGCIAAVAFLREQLRGMADKNDRWDIYGLTASEYELIDDHAHSAVVYAERAKEFPENPMSHATLAEAAARAGNPQVEIVNTIDRALSLALGQDRFVRAVLRARAEIAYRLCDKPLMEDTARKLISDGGRARAEDIGSPQLVKELAERMGIDASLVAQL